MRVPAAILIAACTLAAGCTALTGRSRDRDRDRDRDRTAPAVGRDREWWLDGSETGGRGRARPIPDEVARTNRDTMLAGIVVDARDGRPLKGVTFVRVRVADEVAPASGKGLGFETDPDGSFVVPGLTPGQTYLLSVVREIDGRKIAGEMQVKPPQSNLRLELSEDRVSSVTPPPPPPPGLGPFDTRGADARGPAAPPLPSPPPVDPPAPPLRKENIAGTPSPPPTAAIRPPPPAAPAPAPNRPPVRPAETEPPSARGPAPRVPNFVVSDVLGEDWELRSATGRLILVEFWSTTCVPCARAVPAINRLQATYGRSGLEIVAVACEADAAFAVRAREVDAVARRKEMTYRVYLEREGKAGEIQRLFNVQWVPTLVLLDRQGTVLWRGGASEPELARLDELVTGYLSRR